MTHTTQRSSAQATRSRQVLLTDLLKARMVVENDFVRLGHTYRHGRFYRNFEHAVTRPALKLGLQLAGFYSRGLRNALNPVVANIPLYFPNLPAAFEGFKILHLSDLHIDGTPGLTEALLPLLGSLRPDVCLMTGDYRFEDHGSCEPVYPLMRRILSSIRAPFGIFGILGNHDVSEIAFALENMGVRMLVNESVAIESGSDTLWLTGVDDPFDYQCDDLKQARAGIPPDSFEVLLAHAPEIYEEAAQAGVSLYLTGHTHGGQIRIPGLGAIRQNANCPRAYTFGHWRHSARSGCNKPECKQPYSMQGYTSSGIGCSSLPIRFSCPPEIAMIELLGPRSMAADS